jgi:hypothetical protein
MRYALLLAVAAVSCADASAADSFSSGDSIIGPTIKLDNAGVLQGRINEINCSGTGVTCTVSGRKGTLSITGGGGGGAVTADSPLTGSGTSGSHLAMPAATDSVAGYLTAADHASLTGKLSAVTASSPLSGAGTGASPLVIQTASGSLAGALSSTDWTTFAGKQAGPLTGDVTTSGAAATLASTTVTPGSYGDATHTVSITVDGKGRLTAASANALSGGSGTVTSVVTPPDESSTGSGTSTITITRNNIYRVTGSDFSTTSTLQSTITGLSLNTAANTDYYVHCALAVVGTSTSGVMVMVNASQVTTLAGYEIVDPASTVTTTTAVSFGISCTSGCSASNRPAMLDFMLHTNGNTGTLAIQAAASTAGQAALVKVGSFCMIWTP